VHDETDRHEVFVEVVEERAAAGAHVERPAEGMLDQARLVLRRVDFPQLLAVAPPRVHMVVTAADHDTIGTHEVVDGGAFS